MRTEYCGNISSFDIGKTVKLCGWVDRFRNLGNLIFIDMRDHTGIVQIFFDLNNDPKIFKIATDLRNEYCIQLTGTVIKRKNINKKKKMVI